MKAGVPGAAYQWSSQAAFTSIERLTPRVWRVEEDDEVVHLYHRRYGASGAGRRFSGSAYGPWVDSFLKAALPHASKLPRLCVNTIENGPAATRPCKSWGWRSRPSRPSTGGPTHFEPYTIDQWLHNEETIDLGDDHSLKVLQTPGHTPDSLCLWYERDQILFTGATIQSSSGEDEEALHRSATLLQSDVPRAHREEADA